ncbi:hypothetical protein DYB35_011000 [Aphanomyces astaci]|uniref:Uncharacterized protein n=1 Tax=Aphanomyces astaci TaxID=112090 RepID=A0A3R6XE52_APHAT|nr:hypothetical protein DYB35_011000 [Aphanomyces astaci]
MTTTHLADAYAEYEATVQRRAEVTRRRAGRLGRKRQQERQATELENQAAEGAATLAMRGLDAECRAVERIWRASDALKAYELEQFIYTQSAKCRIVATKEHLGEETPGLRGHKRLTVLQKRVDSFNDRVELANVACADPDQESWNNMTPLLCCLVQRRQDLLRRCLELHANPNFETQDGKTPLLVAIVADDIVAMQILLEPRWKCSPWTETVRGGVTPLLVACEKGRLAAVQLLLAQPSSSIQILTQGLRGNTVHGLTPLMQAAKANHLAVARLLLRHNVNPFVHCKADRSAAEYARAFGHVRMERLVARGNEFNLDPSTPPTYEERMESSALDAIHLALDRSLASTSIDGVLEIVRGDGLASPNHESPDGHMAFLVACAKGDLATVQVLMQLCLWSQPNRHGTTGLLEAASHGHLDVVLHVVSQGGDLNYRDLKGRDAFMRMHDGGHHDMLQYLVQYKAKNNMLLPWWQLAPLPQPGAPLKAPSKLKSLVVCTALLRDSTMADVVSTFCRLNQQTKSLRLWRDMQTLKSVARPSKPATSTAHRIVKTFPTVHCIPSTMYRKVVVALSCAQWPADLAAVLGPCERILVASLYQSMVVPFLQTQAGQRCVCAMMFAGWICDSVALTSL